MSLEDKKDIEYHTKSEWHWLLSKRKSNLHIYEHITYSLGLVLLKEMQMLAVQSRFHCLEQKFYTIASMS